MIAQAVMTTTADGLLTGLEPIGMAAGIAPALSPARPIGARAHA
ncbi:hypothetical protein WJ542_24820 [Paraburkholderia sp. B3]